MLDNAGLKADAYLYLHTAPDSSDANAPAIPIYPTQIKEVAGPIIKIYPPVQFDIGAYNKYFVTGSSRPLNPVLLDTEYYAWLTAAALSKPTTNDTGSPAQELPIGARLVVDPSIEAERSLLSTLIPGDRLLLWDERWREAWYAKRRSAPMPEGLNWYDLSSYQYEAVVKSVDWDTGVIVLSEPIPERFTIKFDVSASGTTPQSLVRTGAATVPFLQSIAVGVNTASDSADNGVNVDAELPTLRILPHYRAPYQGPCTMMPLGSGDKNRKFARYVKTLPLNPGLATVPIQADLMYASNIEVLSLEPRSGEWNRWIQFTNIDNAQKKDRAFTLGVDLAALGSGAQSVPIAVSFGDGIRGQLLPSGADNVYARVTSVGGVESNIDARRPLRILAKWCGQAPFEMPPEAAAAQENLWLRIEFGGHVAWSPIRRSERERPLPDAQTSDSNADWCASMLIEVNDTPWSEVSQLEAQAGYDGYFVRGVRPGVVDVFFLSRSPVAGCSVGAWALPDSGLWILDGDFYANMAKSDPTRATGALDVSLLETDGLRPGSLLAFSQNDASSVEIAEVAEVVRDTWSVTLQSPLSRVYPLATSYLRGNVVEAIQGKTDTYTLGSGDGSTPSLRFAVGNTAPILYAYLYGKSGPEPRITVLVSDMAWNRVERLHRLSPARPCVAAGR